MLSVLRVYLVDLMVISGQRGRKNLAHTEQAANKELELDLEFVIFFQLNSDEGCLCMISQ